MAQELRWDIRGKSGMWEVVLKQVYWRNCRIPFLGDVKDLAGEELRLTLRVVGNSLISKGKLDQRLF